MSDQTVISGTLTLSNACTGVQTVAYQVTPSVGSVIGDPFTLTVNVAQKVTPIFDGFAQQYCAEDETVTLPTASSNYSNYTAAVISGTWKDGTTDVTSFTRNVTAETNTTYSFTPNENTCANTKVMDIKVFAPVVSGAIQSNILTCTSLDTLMEVVNQTNGAGGDFHSYFWAKSQDNGVTWIPVTGVNGADYTQSLYTSSLLGITLYRRSYNTNSCGSQTSNQVSVNYRGNVDPGTITTTAANNNYCPNTSATQTLTAHPRIASGATDYTIQWQSSSNGTDWTNIAGATAETYTYTNNSITDNISFRYRFQLTECEAVSSNNVIALTVYEAPQIDGWTLPVAACPHAGSYDVSVSVSHGTTPYTYTWSAATSTTASAVVAETTNSDICAHTYSVSVTVYDAHNCFVNGNNSFEVKDNQAPTYTGSLIPMLVTGCDATAAPAAVTTIAGLQSTALGNVVFNDNCTDNADLTVSYVDAVPVFQAGLGTTDNPCRFEITRTYTVKDLCNNSTNVTQLITIVMGDFSIPVANGSSTVTCKDAASTIPSHPTNIRDACGNTISSIIYNGCVDNPVDFTCIGTRTYSWTYTDCAGHSHDWSYVYTVNDNVAPVLLGTWPEDQLTLTTCMADQADGPAATVVAACFTDECQNGVNVTRDIVKTGTDCAWNTMYTYTVTDNCSNTYRNASGNFPVVTYAGANTIAPAITVTSLVRTLTSTNCIFKVPDLTAEVLAIATEYCSGTNTGLTATQSPAANTVLATAATVTTQNVVVTVMDACGNQSTKTVVLTIPATLTVAASADQVITHGELTTVSSIPANGTMPYAYNWALTSTGNTTTPTIALPTAASTLIQNFQAGTSPDVYTYTVVVTDANGCVATDDVNITVNLRAQVNDVASQVVCVGATTVAVNFSTVNTGGVTTYAWTNDNPAIGLAASGNGAIAAFTTTNATNSTITATITVTPTFTNGGSSNVGLSKTFTISVDPAAHDMHAMNTSIFCNNNELVITPINGTDGMIPANTLYTWTVAENTLVTGQSANATPTAELRQTLKNLATDYTTQNVIYTLTPITNGCVGENFTATVKVYPTNEITVNCPADINILLDFGQCDTMLAPSVIGLASFTYTNSLYDADFDWHPIMFDNRQVDNIYPEGTTIITWSVMDVCGNVGLCDQTVKVSFRPCPQAVDYDGNTYNSVRIGCDCWTSSNLKSQHYSDGAEIIEVYEYASEVYPNVTENVNTFGRLYSWNAANRESVSTISDLLDFAPVPSPHKQGVCPAGWYLPAASQYAELAANYSTDALKTATLWLDGGGTNTTGFTSLPAGYYDNTIDRYLNLYGNTYYWSSTSGSEGTIVFAACINHHCDYLLVDQSRLRTCGFSVRCIKDRINH